MESLKKSFGRRFRALREARGYSRDFLSQNVDLDEQSLYRLEKGEQWIAPEKLEKVAAFFSVSPAVFFTDDVVRIKPTPLEAWEILGELIQTKQLPPPSDPRIERLLAAITFKPAILDIALDAVRAFESAADDRKRRAPRSSG